MTITVSQEHIDKGKRGVCEKCALALAFVSAGFPLAFVGITSVWPFDPDGDNGYRRWDLPENAITFRESFDRGYAVSPFSFEIEVPTC